MGWLVTHESRGKRHEVFVDGIHAAAGTVEDLLEDVDWGDKITVEQKSHEEWIAGVRSMEEHASADFGPVGVQVSGKNYLVPKAVAEELARRVELGDEVVVELLACTPPQGYGQGSRIRARLIERYEKPEPDPLRGVLQ